MEEFIESLSPEDAEYALALTPANFYEWMQERQED